MKTIPAAALVLMHPLTLTYAVSLMTSDSLNKSRVTASCRYFGERGAVFAELALILVLFLMVATAFPATGMHQVAPYLDQATATANAVGPTITTHWQKLDGTLGNVNVGAFNISAARARTKLAANGYAGIRLCYYACAKRAGAVDCGINEPGANCIALNPAGAAACVTEVTQIASSLPPGDTAFACLRTGLLETFAAKSNTVLVGLP